MLLWAIITTIISFFLLIVLISYRRQIQKICRQLVFMKENNSNMLLNTEFSTKEIKMLASEINEIMKKTNELRKESIQRQDELKETITSLSHDIRTPLTSLDGYFQLLTDTESETEMGNYIQIIQSRIQSLNAMLEELFTYTKLQNEQYQLELSQIDFKQNVFQTVFSFYDEFEKKGITPEIDFEELSMNVNGNEEALKRVLQNMIKNVLEHGKRKVWLKLYEEQGKAVFQCANEIEEGEEFDIERIFLRFYKSDRARGRTSTGLGLAIAKELIQRMNGEIYADKSDNVVSITIKMKKGLS